MDKDRQHFIEQEKQISNTYMSANGENEEKKNYFPFKTRYPNQSFLETELFCLSPNPKPITLPSVINLYCITPKKIIIWGILGFVGYKIYKKIKK